MKLRVNASLSYHGGGGELWGRRQAWRSGAKADGIGDEDFL